MPLEILPSIDLRGGQVVRLKQGDYARQVNYDVDPVETARSFKAAGATWMHIVDLDGAKEGRPVQTELIAKVINQSGLNVEVGGGIRATADIERLLIAGAQRVVVGTKAMEDWHWFESLFKRSEFHDRIVLALDAKNGVVATKGWQESSGKLAVDVAMWVSSWPLAGILYTDVAKDGMMEGPNVEQTRKLCQAGKVPVIASGGVGSVVHIAALTKTPAWGVVVGRSLYEGKVDLREALRVGSGS